MKVLLVDDHPMIRKGIASTLSFEENINQILEATCVEEALNSLINFNPQIAIVDLILGHEDGLDIVKEAKAKSITTKFIILTSSATKEDFLRAQEVGVDGYILKSAFSEDILYTFKVVMRGKKFFDPELLDFHLKSTEKNVLGNLSQREKEVLLELGRGLSNKQIAKRLYISENTVKKHLSSVLVKLGLNQRLEAALYINNLHFK